MFKQTPLRSLVYVTIYLGKDINVKGTSCGSMLGRTKKKYAAKYVAACTGYTIQ